MVGMGCGGNYATQPKRGAKQIGRVCMLKNLIKRISGAKRSSQLLGRVSKQENRRRFLLDMLPKHSVGAEIGVHLGDFSQQIIKIVF